LAQDIFLITAGLMVHPKLNFRLLLDFGQKNWICV